MMNAQIRYLTHPQVNIEPAVPVPSWGLSEVGRTRTETLANAGSLAGTTQIVCSGERKAMETAGIIAAKLNVTVEVREAMHENDRSATGFLAPASLRRSLIGFSHNRSSASGDGSAPSMPSCVSSARSNW